MTLQELLQWIKESKRIAWHSDEHEGNVESSTIYEHKGEYYLVEQSNGEYYALEGGKDYQPLKVTKKEVLVPTAIYYSSNGYPVFRDELGGRVDVNVTYRESNKLTNENT